MTFSDNTIQAKRLADFFRSLGNNGLKKSKEDGKERFVKPFRSVK